MNDFEKWGGTNGRRVVLGTWMHPPPMAPMTLLQQAAAWPWLQVVGGEVVVGTAEAMMAVERMVMMVNCILKGGLGMIWKDRMKLFGDWDWIVVWIV